MQSIGLLTQETKDKLETQNLNVYDKSETIYHLTMILKNFILNLKQDKLEDMCNSFITKFMEVEKSSVVISSNRVPSVSESLYFPQKLQNSRSSNLRLTLTGNSEIHNRLHSEFFEKKSRK